MAIEYWVEFDFDPLYVKGLKFSSEVTTNPRRALHNAGDLAARLTKSDVDPDKDVRLMLRKGKEVRSIPYWSGIYDRLELSEFENYKQQDAACLAFLAKFIKKNF